MATKRGLPTFSGRQRGMLRGLFCLSREITGEHFRLGEHELQNMPCEVCTLEDLSGEEIHPHRVLADIARYEFIDKGRGRKRDLYRINLQDHNILELLRSRRRELGFSPLLLYVLTHELVHVVRFLKFLTPFHVADQKRLEEEARVHDITQALLKKLPWPGMTEVLSHFEPLAKDPTMME